MVIGLGVDVFEVARMEAELRAHGADLARQLFTSREIGDCIGLRHPARHYAARFAAKEAVIKALSPGDGAGTCWHDIEVREEGGRRVVLHGRMLRLAKRRGVGRIHVSFSHTRAFATASVVLES
jgi:holo-[acyl-carrier protein] synthase